MEDIQAKKLKKAINYYSGIKRPTISEDETLDFFYKRVLQPIFILLGVFLSILLTQNLSKIYYSIFEKGNTLDGLLFVSIIFISIFALIRAYQSIYLARIDYLTLKKKKFDHITFTAVVIVFSCIEFIVYNYDQITLIFASYTLIACIATINFWTLYSWRLKNQEDEIDYVCEKKIQCLNFIVFCILTISFLLITVLRWFDYNETSIYIGLSSVICILLLINIIHSRELTFIPKIILCNDKDVDDCAGMQKLRICRMHKKNAGRIAITLIDEFKYVYEYIFETTDEKILKRIIYHLVKSCHGFGFLGYMHFYSIEQNNKKIGLMKIDTRFKSYIYQSLELLELPIIISTQFGVKKLPIIYKRAKEIISGQPQIQNKKEFELTYFVIYKNFRGRGYGTDAVRLLVNALFHSEKTNNIDCSRLLSLVREKNEASIALFEKNIGCKRILSKTDKNDPLAKNEKIGNSIFFEYKS